LESACLPAKSGVGTCFEEILLMTLQTTWSERGGDRELDLPICCWTLDDLGAASMEVKHAAKTAALKMRLVNIEVDVIELIPSCQNE
jgi:hypothetical protein